MKNLLTQWDIEEENQKILKVFGKKPLNLIKNKGRKPNNRLVKKSPHLRRDEKRKPEKIKQKRDLGLLCLPNSNGGRLSKSTTIFY